MDYNPLSPEVQEDPYPYYTALRQVRATNRPSAEVERAEIQHSTAEMRSYFQHAIARRRTEPRDDLLTALVRAEEEQQVLTADEVLAMALLILLAGNETTTNLLGNSVGRKCKTHVQPAIRSVLASKVQEMEGNYRSPF